jgi:hypothetical protein
MRKEVLLTQFKIKGRMMKRKNRIQIKKKIESEIEEDYEI